MALSVMARVALSRTHREAGNGHRVAPARFSFVLDLEESTANGPSGCATRRSRPHSRALDGESALGGTADSRRVAEVGDLGQSVDRRHIHAAASAPAVTNVADLPYEPREPDHGRRPVRRADGHVPALFVLVMLGHDRRRIVHLAVTEHPTAAWTAQQLRNAFPEQDAPTYLVHDRDAIFADVATTVVAMNMHAVRTAPRSPWQNAYVERLIGSIRRECLDHLIVVNATALHRILTDYVAYYMCSRTHLALGKDAPTSRPVVRRRLGGSWRRRRSAGSTTVTIAQQPDARRRPSHHLLRGSRSTSVAPE